MNAKTSRVALLFLVAALLIAVAACTKKEAPPPAKPTRISATAAYEKYFGPAPTTDKGTCYAFVIYFPSAKEPGKVVPFPFFTFDEGTIKKVAVERLLGGMNVGSYQGEFLQPLPPDAHLLGITEANGVVTVDFGKEILKGQADAKGEQALLNALSLTVSQFDGVKGVRVQVEGKEQGTVEGKEVADFLGHGGLKRQPLTADESTVLEPGPPRLLSLTAVKDKGAKNVEDVNAYFDRPVEIQELRMTDRDGKTFAGETFQSVFDMAAVLKPKDPGVFKAQMPIKVRWKVTDKRGRQGEGDNVWFLEVKEH
jgi:germination protein M